MNYTQFQIPENLLEDFDTDLQIFYHNVFLRQLNLSVVTNIGKVKQALKEVVHAYKKPTVDCNASSILFDSPEKRCAYLMKHCPCFTSAVARHFLQLARTHPSTNLLSAVHRRQVNLCCLGGGPGTDAVAVAKVVNALNNAVCLPRRQKLQLRVQVVDLSKDWETTATLVIETLNETPKLCDSERMVVSFEFLEADLTQPWKEPVRKVLADADIITMVYFVSAVNGSKAQSKCASMLKEIVDVSKPGALLFFLDSSKDLHYDAVHSAVCQQKNNLRLVHGPVVQEFHTLSMKSIRKFIGLYFSQFNAILCLTNCFVTTAGWSKVGATGIRDGTYVEARRHPNCQCCCFSISGKRRRWQKTMKHNTRKQEWFRQRVEKLLLSELKMNFAIDDLKEQDAEPPECFLPCKAGTLYATKSKQRRIVAF